MSDTTVTTPDGVPVYVTVDGPPSSAVPLLLVHGITRSAATWNWLVARQLGQRQLIRVDLRGHGRSGRAAPYEPPDWVTDVVCVLDQVLDRPAVLVGHSLGGAVAATVIQQRPDDVRAAVLLDPATALAEPLPGAEAGGPLLDVFTVLRRTIPRMQQQGVSASQLAERIATAPTATGERHDQLFAGEVLLGWAASHLQLDARVLDTVLEPTPDQPTIGLDLDAPLAVPTLVLAAALDAPDRQLGRRHEQRMLAAASPELRIEHLPGGHDLADQRGVRQLVAAELDRFLVDHG